MSTEVYRNVNVQLCYASVLADQTLSAAEILHYGFIFSQPLCVLLEVFFSFWGGLLFFTLFLLAGVTVTPYLRTVSLVTLSVARKCTMDEVLTVGVRCIWTWLCRVESRR